MSLRLQTAECPLLALSGHHARRTECPLSEAKRTCRLHCELSAYDPKRTFVLCGFRKELLHLCGVALVTDWQNDFGLPPDLVKGGLCMSGMYDMKPVRLSKRSSYVKSTDAMEQAMSSQRQIEKLRAPIIVTYGTNETPEFQRQNRDFAAAVKAAGKPVELIEAPNYNHFEMCETLGNPYGPNGRAALKLMKVA